MFKKRNIFLVYDKRASTPENQRFLNTILKYRIWKPKNNLVIMLNSELVYLKWFKTNNELFFYNVIDVPLV